MKKSLTNVSLQPAQTGIFDHLIAELIFETDPSVFGCLVRNDREIFSRWITPLWQLTECSYSYDCATLALGNGELLGFEQGFAGSQHVFLENRSGKAATGTFSKDLLEHMAVCSRFRQYYQELMT